MKEYYIDRTISLHECYGEVHIIFKEEFEGEEVCLMWNAYELLKDLPHIYDLAKRADKREQDHIKEKYRDLSKQIFEDVKKPVGRPPKE